jgi:crossover junction endodeoxyribonuclease RusA
MRVVEFTVFGVAQPKGSTKAWTRIVHDKVTGRPKPLASITSSNDKLKPWEHDIRAAIQNAAPGVFFDAKHAVGVRLLFVMPRPTSLAKRILHHLTAPDLDKLIRGSLDALKGKIWADDSQVVHVNAWKVYGLQPRAEYRITDIDEPITPDLMERVEQEENLTLPW